MRQKMSYRSSLMMGLQVLMNWLYTGMRCPFTLSSEWLLWFLQHLSLSALTVHNVCGLSVSSQTKKFAVCHSGLEYSSHEAQGFTLNAARLCMPSKREESWCSGKCAQTFSSFRPVCVAFKKAYSDHQAFYAITRIYLVISAEIMQYWCLPFCLNFLIVQWWSFCFMPQQSIKYSWRYYEPSYIYHCSGAVTQPFKISAMHAAAILHWTFRDNCPRDTAIR